MITKNESFLGRYGPRLLENGFPIVPIKRGYKFPKGLRNWQDSDADKQQLRAWLANGFATGGVGLKTKHFPAVDIDVRDETIAAKLVEFVRREVGDTVERVGEAPKTLLVFRTEEPFNKMRSRVYEDWLGERHAVEILGDGQQFVAYAEHPDTGKPYQWVGDGLADVSPDDLPVLTRDQAARIFEYFYSLRPADWQEVEPESAGRKQLEGDAFSRYKPPLDVANDRISRALQQIPNDGEGAHYDSWVRYGMALYHQFAGSEAGFELWDRWSSQSDKYDGDITRDKWFESGNFDANLERVEPVTVATILHDAEKYRRESDPDPLESHLKRYVYIEAGDRVADLERPPRCCLAKLIEHRNRTANVRHEIPAPTQANPDKTILEPVHKQWLAHVDRQTADDTIYRPGRPRIVRDGSGTYINVFELAEHPDTGRTDHLGVFFEHMAYLIPDEQEREWFVDWLAFNVQHPDRRCLVTPLHVSTAHGTGRGWCVRLLERLLGEWNLKKTKMEQLANENAQFNDYLHESLVVAVEEVREGGRRYEVSDRIRDVLTEPRLEINRKYGAKSTERVYCNFFLMSNHRDALALPQEDRRIAVLTGPDQAKPNNYYDNLYGWLESPGLGELFHYLKARDLSAFDFRRAPHTRGRSLMVEGAKSETEFAYETFRENMPAPVMTFESIRKTIANSMENPFENLDEKQLLALVRGDATQHRRLKVDGKIFRVWVFSEKNFRNSEIAKILRGSGDGTGVTDG